MRNFLKSLQEQGSESAFSLLTALIYASLFGVAVAVSMRLVTDQFSSTSSLTLSTGRSLVTKTVAEMDCCETLRGLTGGSTNALVSETCDNVNGRITQTYGYTGIDIAKISITPRKSTGAEIGVSQTSTDTSFPARDIGRYLGRWNYSVRCDFIDIFGASVPLGAAKYLKILTWRLGVDPLTNEQFQIPEEVFEARSCAGVLNGSRTCP